LAQYKDITSTTDIFHAYANPAFLGSGLTFVDYNQDGWLDIAMTGGSTPDRLFKNLSNGKFEDQSQLLSKHFEGDLTSAIVSGDLNNDGCDDVVICAYGRDQYDIILKNNCDGTFAKISIENALSSLGNSIGATLFDFNQDGLLDIYILNHVAEIRTETDEEGAIIGYDHECDKNHLYINQGDFQFEEQGEILNAQGEGCGLAVTVIPVPEREAFGIYLANDFGPFLIGNEFLVPDTNGSYIDQAFEYGVNKRMYGMGIGVGDFDNDLDLDMYVSNLGENILYQNLGDFFIETQRQYNVDNTSTPDDRLTTGWGTFFLDVDNDTDLDVFVANGTVFSPGFIEGSFNDPNQLFINRDGNYVQTKEEYGIYFIGQNINRGAAFGDIDNDGDLDIVTAYVNFDPTDDPARIYRVYRNDNDPLHFIDINLVARNGALDAFGAQVTIYYGNEAQLQYKYSGGTHASQNTELVHFGLGETNHIDSILVLWPNFEESKYFDVPVNQTIQLSDNKETYDIIGCMDTENSRYNDKATINSGCELDLSTATNELIDDLVKIHVAQKTLYIKVENPEQYSFKIFNSAGQAVSRTKTVFIKDIFQVNVDFLVDGIYFVQLISNEGMTSKPISIF